MNELVLGLSLYKDDVLRELFCLSLLDTTSSKPTDSVDKLLKQQSLVSVQHWSIFQQLCLKVLCINKIGMLLDNYRKYNFVISLVTSHLLIAIH